ncbi:MAG: aldo/keto reductase [Bacteroidetes bacterium]|nr:MAG: aldo/keto reductase [Bacteroidota bacterium]
MKDKRSKIAIGTVQFGLHYGIGNRVGKTVPSEVAKILNTAYDKGIRVLDTAQEYGESEQVIGGLHDHRFQIITKINPSPRYSQSTQMFVKKSLTNLKINDLYGLLFHSANSALQNSRVVSDLKDLQQQGIIQKLGYSVYTPSELNLLISKYGNPDIIQVPYSHLDQRFQQIAIDLHQDGVEIHTRSTFLQGLFFMEPTELQDFFNPVKNYLEELKELFGNSERIASALLNWVLDKPFIDKVVIGVNSNEQLESNLQGLEALSVKTLPEPKNVPEELLMPNLWPKD